MTPRTPLRVHRRAAVLVAEVTALALLLACTAAWWLLRHTNATPATSPWDYDPACAKLGLAMAADLSLKESRLRNLLPNESAVEHCAQWSALAFNFGFMLVGALLAICSGAALNTEPGRGTLEQRMRLAFNSFRKYIPSPVFNNIVRRNEEPSVGLHKAEATVFFLDVCNFTGSMHTHGCEKMLSVLTEMWAEFTSILEQQGGVIDKYIGDGIMATFQKLDHEEERIRIQEHYEITGERLCSNSNYDSEAGGESHQKRACEAAFRILQVLDDLNKRFVEVYGLTVSVRIGIGSGSVWQGNVGSRTRLNFTVMGEPVNLAARLEPLAKKVGVQVCVSDEVRLASEPTFAFRCIGVFQVRGFSDDLVRVHQFLGRRDSLPQADREMLDNYAAVDVLFMSPVTDGVSTSHMLQAYVMDHPGDVVAADACMNTVVGSWWE
eukprot:TRINITY_DN4153_c0_g1_i2.p1 TRINITY_DN4153_c0_g1~~TRINITY_DN4153_c0_g1_i2.p1  ORF type:complete len:436 (+),score=99.02 TRINITY_DN4153_c0_g1_i2:139-1446(+)